MDYSPYTDRLKKATQDLATRATQHEASLSTLSPLTSPLPTLHKAFPLYVSAAEQYSLLLTTKSLPEYERSNAKKRWRLVLERAEKVKKRIEDLGGHVGKVGAGDEVEEEAVMTRGGVMNGVKLDSWREPSASTFRTPVEALERQPELAKEQEALDPEWAPVDPSSWDIQLGQSKWVVRQGPGADCSVVAGLGACLEHNRRWNTTLAQDTIWPRRTPNRPIPSENGRHVIKLLLNGAWRSVVIDHLLPRTKTTHLPLHATTHPATSPSNRSIGPPWLPLILKGYYTAHGGYSLTGSNPAPDVYNLTGWIPERIGLRDGFQREKEWRRVKEGWDKGNVIVTLGTGSRQDVSEGLIPYHAYAVLDITEESGGERVLKVYDPGTSKHHAEGLDLARDMEGLSLEGEGMTPSGLFARTWDQVCAEFETLSLNWNPALLPVTAKRHWSWPKPVEGDSRPASSLRYKLDLTCTSVQPGSEVWILLSQHITNKDRSSDDIALHVHEEHQAVPIGSSGSTAQVEKMASSSPYSNAVHVLYRHTVRRDSTSLIILPLRDRGLYRTDFTLQALAPSGSKLFLERISTSLPFSTSLTSSLTTRNAGGHAGLPSWIDNPQYKLVLSASPGARKSNEPLRVMLQGEKEMAWNIKLLWGKGELAFDWGGEASLGDSGPYSYGMAYADIPSVEPGTYTLAISAFEPKQIGQFTLSVESALPAALTAIPAEGAGMYSRTMTGIWTESTSGGRPSGGSFQLNPKIEITLPRECTIMARAILPQQGTTIPINLTMFQRGTNGSLGEQIATSGPYSDTVYGVLIPRSKVGSGVYILVISPWERGMGLGEKWEVRVWADGPLEAEIAR